jgi:hypothetical protein
MNEIEVHPIMGVCCVCRDPMDHEKRMLTESDLKAVYARTLPVFACMC